MKKNETKEFLIGPAGKLELLLTQPETPDFLITAIICHPHPLFGGTLHNKIVTTLASFFHKKGVHTIRFNFRGVGLSEGVYDEGKGEQQDLIAIMNEIKCKRPTHAIWLAGFSFGGFVAASVATRIPVAKLITVAPAISFFPAQLQVTSPWIIIQGEEDEVVSPAAVYHWVEHAFPKPILIRIPHTGHFFHGKLLELKKALESGLPMIC